MLSVHQHDEFRATGLLHLRQAFAPAAAAAMCDRVWEFLADRDAVERDDPSTWPIGQPSGFQPVTHSGIFRTVGGDPMCAALDELLGSGQWAHPRWWGRPLVTFPQPGPWELPTRAWHFDYTPASTGPRPLQFFAFLNQVRPHGGGTLVLAGSHRLVAPYLDLGKAFRLDRVRTSLTAHPWLRELWHTGGGNRIQRYMNDGTVIDGVPLRVVELTGEPGDVVLMHSDCFHAAAPNRLTEPRMMLTEMVAPDHQRQ